MEKKLCEDDARTNKWGVGWCEKNVQFDLKNVQFELKKCTI